MKRVAIVGLSPDSHEDAPWGDDSWQVWGLPWDAYGHHCDVLFEMHEQPDAEFAAAGIEVVRYKHWKCDLVEDSLGIPIYMHKADPDIADAVDYPFEETEPIVEGYGYGSSIAYMLALAIAQKADQIGIWGVSLSDSIYDHQRPNIEYLIGYSRGRGITCDIHGETSLMTLKHGPRYGAL